MAAALKPMRRPPIAIAALAVDVEGAVPAPVDAVELQQMRGRRGAALELVDMDDVEPVGGPRVVILAPHAAERRTQHKPPDATHPVYADRP